MLSALLLAGCGNKPVVLKENLKKYDFEPPVLRVKRGQAVTLELQTSDVRHSFLVPDLNLQQAVPPGQRVTLTFKGTVGAHSLCSATSPAVPATMT